MKSERTPAPPSEGQQGGRRRIAVFFPGMPQHPRDVAGFGALVDGGLAERLWLGQALTVDAHPTLAYLAGMGQRISVGLGVSVIPLRHPYDAALQARSLAVAMQRPVVACFGVGPPEAAGGLRSRPYRSPRVAACEYAACVRALLDGAPPPGAGEYFAVRLGLIPMPHPRVEVGLGVLRPRMARSAGAVADVAVTWLTPPWYVRDTLVPQLARGAGSRRPPRLVAVVHVALARRGRDPRALAVRAAGGHLRSEPYVDMLRRAGVATDPGDVEAGASALVDRGVFAYGDAAAVAVQVEAYHDAGVDEVVLNTAGVFESEGPQAAIEDVRELLAAASPGGRAGIERAEGRPPGKRGARHH